MQYASDGEMVADTVKHASLPDQSDAAQISNLYHISLVYV